MSSARGGECSGQPGTRHTHTACTVKTCLSLMPRVRCRSGWAGRLLLSWAPQVTKVPSATHKAASPSARGVGSLLQGDRAWRCPVASAPFQGLTSGARPPPASGGGMVTPSLGGRRHTRWHLPGAPRPSSTPPTSSPGFCSGETYIKRPILPCTAQGTVLRSQRTFPSPPERPPALARPQPLSVAVKSSVLHAHGDAGPGARSFQWDFWRSAPCFQAGPCPWRPSRGPPALDGHVAVASPSLSDGPRVASAVGGREQGCLARAWAGLGGVLLSGFGAHTYIWAPPCFALSPGAPVTCGGRRPWPHFLWSPGQVLPSSPHKKGPYRRQVLGERAGPAVCLRTYLASAPSFPFVLSDPASSLSARL